MLWRLHFQPSASRYPILASCLLGLSFLFFLSFFLLPLSVYFSTTMRMIHLGGGQTLGTRLCLDGLSGWASARCLGRDLGSGQLGRDVFNTLTHSPASLLPLYHRACGQRKPWFSGNSPRFPLGQWKHLGLDASALDTEERVETFNG